jgi:uncharacterized YccA/Bax inhibitor family protein
LTRDTTNREMREMRYTTSNPVMTKNFFANIQGQSNMTFEGTISKLAYLLGIVFITACISGYVALDAINSGNSSVLAGLTWGGMIGGIIVVVILIFTRPQNPAALMTIYAAFQGLFIGGISIMYETFFEGIIIQAGFGTLMITMLMLGLYSSRIIRPTPTFNKVVYSVLGCVFMLYMLSIVVTTFSPYQIPYLHSSGPIGIGITLVILIFVSLSLISDFGFIESGVKWQAPKSGEWWGAFGVLITIIWIYIEMIRLISKLRD